MTAASTPLTFTGAHGDPLAARLELPPDRPRAYAVFAHCFACGKDSHAASRISKALTSYGIAVLRFDFTGLGQSGGDFADTTFSSNMEDLVRAADHLREHHRAPTVLIGHSLGGTAALAAAHRVPEVQAVATIGAPAAPVHVTRLFGDYRTQLAERGRAEAHLSGRTVRVSSDFVEDLLQQPQDQRVRSLDAALLVMHSPSDQVVAVDNARQIFDTARHPKSYIALPDADHLLTDRADADYAAAVLAAWAHRYTDTPAAVARP
ncbi:alpha/beta hydrolase family protein [Streptomyces spectabilis]|uniref:Alpha/beta fold hydrolase n=1 Tax=Streptomyces spectabilis TaxID=68270 RepID=A0A5P2X6Q8_STRST|nr:alpha/beta fold hydrolase [Streptomyces spectabilis]MBB5101526.1 putative redox protein [Streptomyces spectabilis]MCI3900715.1 alpha/beta hydrolase [Streptomyces spectabilis]QEV58256.1 alpha/beta fold hydrolase [Streptomyces spectabilis]GGV11946.1 hypothetical protein GCM10010245_22100 [Streptomyces spectabilis]